MHHSFARFGLLAAALSLLGGCPSPGKGDAGTDCAVPDRTAQTFLAFSCNFEDYRTWTPSFHYDGGVDAGVAIHLSGPRTEYINMLPDAGSAAFPIGTIIVKEVEVGDIPNRQVFAMVKRGGGYNAQGAMNWEWFELQNVDQSSVTIIWHGVGPPAGETYGGDPNASCNTCHSAAASNDYVQSPSIRLNSL